MNELGCFFAYVIAIALAIWGFVTLLRRLPGPELRRRLDDLESQLSLLRADIARLRAEGLEAEQAPETEAPRSETPAGEVASQPVVAAPPPALPAAPPVLAGTESAIGPGAPRTSDEPIKEPIDEPADEGAPPSPFESVAQPVPARVQINWEQWLGVRGAALLGGIALVISGILLVRVGIQAGLITPTVRVILVMVAGLVALVTSEVLRKRDFETTANSLAGAGIVLLYGATWAARNLYDLIGPWAAFGLMALATLAGGGLSMRHRSLVIALLGLIGGFATPLLIDSGSDQPVGLFGYLLLLNVGVAFVGKRRDWPFLSLLGLAATALYQMLWIFGQMEERVVVGLTILGVFALFYLGLGWLRRRGSEPQRAAHLLTEIGAIVSPFLFAFYFAANADLGDTLLGLLALLLPLSAMAVFLGRAHRLAALGVGAASAGFAIVVVWWLRADLDSFGMLQGVGALVAFAALFHVFFEFHKNSECNHVEARPAILSSVLGVSWLALFSLARSLAGATLESHFWILLAGLGALIALLLRQASLLGATRSSGAEPSKWAWVVSLLEPFAALASGAFVAGALWRTDADPEGHPSAYVVLALALVAAVGHLAWSRRTLSAGPYRPLATLALCAVVGLALFAGPGAIALTPWHALLAGSLFGFVATLAATACGSGSGFSLALVVTALAQLFWVNPANETPMLSLVIGLATMGLFLYWPLLSRKFDGATAFRAAALSGPLWFPFLWDQWNQAVGTELSGLLPILLGGATVVAVRWAMSRPTDDADLRLSRLVWLSAVALGFAALAVPLQLDHEWITLGWAIEGLLVTLLWRRLDHAGLKYFGTALHLAVFVRLVLNVEVLGYQPVGAPLGLPILNWLLYTYLVPAAALVLSARALVPLEVVRARSWENWYRAGRQVIATLYGLLAVILGFCWINLTIFDAFTPGTELAISFDRLPARDLTLSLSWAVYALLLLGVGVARRSTGLRWTSLAMLMITIAKVFLYDLGELTDLYRVFSLFGLSISLILVSLLYQRFVFRRDKQTETEAGPTA